MIRGCQKGTRECGGVVKSGEQGDQIGRVLARESEVMENVDRK